MNTLQVAKCLIHSSYRVNDSYNIMVVTIKQMTTWFVISIVKTSTNALMSPRNRYQVHHHIIITTLHIHLIENGNDLVV